MKIYVQFFGQFREQFKTSYFWLTLPSEATIIDILEELEKLTGVDVKNSIMNPDKEDIRSDVSIFINGRAIAFLNGLRSKLNDMDKLIIAPPIAGG